jgi:hypothetical protein
MTPARPPDTLPVWRRLHARAALRAAPLLLLLGAGMYLLLQHYSAQTALEAGQRMNLALAPYVIDHQEPGVLDAQGRPSSARVLELAMRVMKINPAVEVYFLDPPGRVLAHALEGLEGADPVGTRVDMVPIRQLLAPAAGAALRLPLPGTDPLQPNRPNAFSVAPFMSGAGGVDAYLYIVLSGRLMQGDAAAHPAEHRPAGYGGGPHGAEPVDRTSAAPVLGGRPGLRPDFLARRDRAPAGDRRLPGRTRPSLRRQARDLRSRVGCLARRRGGDVAGRMKVAGPSPGAAPSRRVAPDPPARTAGVRDEAMVRPRAVTAPRRRTPHPVLGIRHGSISCTGVEAKRGTFSVSCIDTTRSPSSPESSTERT